MNLKLVIVAVVPTGAAIICILWAYRRRKVPSLEKFQKQSPAVHSLSERFEALDPVKSEYRTKITLSSSNERLESGGYAYLVEDHNSLSNRDNRTACKLLLNDGSCKDFIDTSEQIRTFDQRPEDVTGFPFDVTSCVVDNALIEVVTTCDGNVEQVERLSSLEDKPCRGCMNQSGNEMHVNGSGGKDCLSISEEMLEDLLKQDVADEKGFFETHGPSQSMPAKQNYDKESQVTKPAIAFRKSIGCSREFDQGTGGSLSDQEMGWRSSSTASQDSAIVSSENKGGGDVVFYSDNKVEQMKKRLSQYNKKLMDNISTIYKFDFPTELCGRLIGRQGKNVGTLKKKSGADLFLQTKLYSTEYKVVCLQGTPQQVNKALHLIKKKFPEKKFTGVDYEKHSADVPPESVGITQLNMPVGAPLDVVVSNVISVNHLFLHLPSHPTFLKLEILTSNMKKCYNLDCCVPDLPRPIEVGIICVAPAFGFWYRAQILEVNEEEDEYDIKLVDYGGYLRLRGSALKQIRKDFVDLPFQAIECYLANVVPPYENEDFPKEAKRLLEKLVDGNILQAEVVAVEHDGVPYVELTCVQDCQVKFVNRELIDCGVAKWAEM